ncbi:MAG: DUF4271 domain-containing protein [Bacteroidota bacterium]
MLAFLIRYLLVIAILAMGFVAESIGQDTTSVYNPFELQERLPPEEKVERPEELSEKETKAEKEDTVSQVVGNPFDLPEDQIKSSDKTPAKGADDSPLDISSEPWSPEIPDFTSGKPITDFWLGMYVIFLGIILAILNTMFGEHVKRTIRAFSSYNMLNLSFRHLGDKISNYVLLLFVFYVLCASLFLFLIVNHFEFAGLGFNLTTFGLALGFLLLVTFLRHLLLITAGAIFPFEKEIRFYRHTINVFDYVIGFVLFPLIVVIAFAPKDISSIAILVGLGIISIIYLFRCLRGLTIAKKYLAFHKFHFFLYLCTVEIAPLLIVVKLLTIWGSAV